jgi:hypothetical protein
LERKKGLKLSFEPLEETELSQICPPAMAGRSKLGFNPIPAMGMVNPQGKRGGE